MSTTLFRSTAIVVVYKSAFALPGWAESPKMKTTTTSKGILEVGLVMNRKIASKLPVSADDA